MIVFFLTDPSEIYNCSIDLNGLRPKVIHQNGIKMESNFQTNVNEFLLNESGVNGMYEANGNHHFRDHMKNESDEDFGPETDVDALDDVLTSPKNNLNSFGSDCWQKGQINSDNGSNKLIEFARDETVKVKENFPQEYDESSYNEKNATENLDSNNYETKTGNELNNMNFLNDSEIRQESNSDDKFVNEEMISGKKYEETMSFEREKKNDDNNILDLDDLKNEKEFPANEFSSTNDKNPFRDSVINNYSEVINANDSSDANEIVAEEVNLQQMDNTADVKDFNAEKNENESKENVESALAEEMKESELFAPRSVDLDKQTFVAESLSHLNENLENKDSGNATSPVDGCDKSNETQDFSHDNKKFCEMVPDEKRENIEEEEENVSKEKPILNETALELTSEEIQNQISNEEVTFNESVKNESCESADTTNVSNAAAFCQDVSYICIF